MDNNKIGALTSAFEAFASCWISNEVTAVYFPLDKHLYRATIKPCLSSYLGTLCTFVTIKLPRMLNTQYNYFGEDETLLETEETNAFVERICAILESRGLPPGKKYVQRAELTLV